MKIAVINDTHFGAKKGNDLLLEYQLSFFEDKFFPYLIENNIKEIAHLGDFFDNRRTIDFKTLNKVEKRILDKIKSLGFKMTVSLGNHDCFWKNTNSLNSLKLLLSRYENIEVVENPLTKKFDDLEIGILPWICPENEESIMSYIKQTNAQILFGHLDVVGFDMIQGGIAKSTDGFSKETFAKFDDVYTGHYHTKSSQDNIHYLGTQYELTWADSWDPKHFHVLDTDTREMTPIRNSKTLFNKVCYTSSKDKTIIQKDQLNNTFVKAIVVKKDDLYEFDKWITEIESCEPADLKIIESYDEYSADKIDDKDLEVLDTPRLMEGYINSLNTNLNKDVLNNVMQKLLIEAQQIGL
jgi:hypothetical protein